MKEEYLKIITELGKERVCLNEPLSAHCTFKIGGPADLFYEAREEKELLTAVKLCRKLGVPFFILGGGSKILAGDQGFRGLVILNRCLGLEFENQAEGVLVRVSSGMITSELLTRLAAESLTGLEFMAGIPGTIGGAVRGNAGAWQQTIGEKVIRVKILNEGNKVLWLDKKDCSFDYRESRFKHNSEVILAVELALTRGSREQIMKQMKEILIKRSQQPKEPSVGSIFINPKPLAAGSLIEAAGFKGQKVGGAKVAEAHANFIVNLGWASAKDVVALIEKIKAKIKEQEAIDLKEEVVKIGEF